MKERIKMIMQSVKMSQQEFANKLELSPASLSSIFTGRTNPTIMHVDAIHRAFPWVNTNWLMYGEGEMSEDEKNITSCADQYRQDKDGVELCTEGPKIIESKQSLVNDVKDYNQSNESTYNSRNIQVNNIDNKKKQAREIRIFYDDGTYEIFVPMKR